METRYWISNINIEEFSEILSNYLVLAECLIKQHILTADFIAKVVD